MLQRLLLFLQCFLLKLILEDLLQPKLILAVRQGEHRLHLRLIKLQQQFPRCLLLLHQHLVKQRQRLFRLLLHHQALRVLHPVVLHQRLLRLLLLKVY